MFGRGYTVAVNGDGAHVGAGAAHLSEAGLALVILYVDAADALQGVADVGVGELAHLVGGNDVGDAQRVLLRGEGAALALESAAHYDFLQLDAFAQREVADDGGAFGHGDGGFDGGVTHVVHADFIRAGVQVGEGVESVDVADDARMEGFDVDRGARQGLAGIVDDAAADGALLRLVHIHIVLVVQLFVGQNR